jgi:hypothetical protein
MQLPHHAVEVPAHVLNLYSACTRPNMALLRLPPPARPFFRHDIFSAAQKKEVETLVQENREFRSIWEERARSKGVTTAAAGADAGQEAGAPVQNGGAAADGQAEQQQQMPDGSMASVQRSQLGAAGAGGSRIKIVVNTPQPEGDAAAAAAGGLKRPSHAAGDDPHYQQQQQEEAPAAKRQRHDVNGTSGSPSAAGAGHMDIDGSGAAGPRQPVPLLPELAAALESPSELQVAMRELLEQRKLCLVLDLDHTLVNSVKFNEVDPEWEFKLEQMVAQQVGCWDRIGSSINAWSSILLGTCVVFLVQLEHRRLPACLLSRALCQ